MRANHTTLALMVAAAALLTACAAEMPGMGGGMGMGMGSGMMERHGAAIPETYAGLTNPVPADAASLARGEAVYQAQCASCHGLTGMGEGEAGQALNPAPAPVAHTSQMLGDDYLFWRLSEGGVPFQTAMPAWKDTLNEEERWDVVNYLRALGAGQVGPQPGAAAAAQATAQAETLTAAVTQGLLTPAEAETYARLHALVEARLQTDRANLRGTGPERRAAVVQTLMTEGALTEVEASWFEDTHAMLAAAGLMR